MNTCDLPLEIFSGYFHGGHCQGIAVDTARKFIYYSFTTELVKTDLNGRLIGSVTGLLGHLGCIDFCDADGKVYGSLEYKNDAIGKGILANLGSDAKVEDAFYMAVFDVDRIDRPGMDAARDGVMRTVYLKEVVDDYKAVTPSGAHRHGCSGIDGTTFGPMPGSEDGKRYLFVAYGVYGDVARRDNNYQVLLAYDTSKWECLLSPLCQEDMHHNGPERPDAKLFVYTGNTEYGVQNLEYDEYTGNYLMAVYRGKKPQFPNHAMYIVDGARPPRMETLAGVEPETRGLTLSLWPHGEFHAASGVYGWEFRRGSTGLCSLGDGFYYVSCDGRDDNGWYTKVRLYHWDGLAPLSPVEG